MQTMTQLGLFVAASVVEVAPCWGTKLGAYHQWRWDQANRYWVATCNPLIATPEPDKMSADKPAKPCSLCEAKASP